MTITERLGSFYLGKEYDLAAGKLSDVPVMYDARDLTTHAVCVGMTGSGKTGLCIDLMEEAAIDRCRRSCIDPKGDITNLLLTFPDLLPEDFQPWINADDARRKDMTVEAYAANQAETWAKGLAELGPGAGAHQAAQGKLPTSSSTPRAPMPACRSASSAPSTAPQLELGRRAGGPARSASAARSARCWAWSASTPTRCAAGSTSCWPRSSSTTGAAARTWTWPQLIMAIQTPPVRQLGVFDVDTFYPQKDRFGLAMALNNIIAAPTFATWIQGMPLDIDHMLHGGDGKPSVSIFYIAHLSDAERMFFVTLLLEQMITWMRGTARHHQPARPALHGRGLRLFPAQQPTRPASGRC